jgi:hypothetical protein
MTTNNTSLTQKLVAVFGIGAKITAEVEEDGRANFHDTNNETTLGCQLEESVVLFGAGKYDITVNADSFDFTEQE